MWAAASTAPDVMPSRIPFSRPRRLSSSSAPSSTRYFSECSTSYGSRSRYAAITVATSRALGSWPTAALNVRRATVGSVMPASVNSPMSAGMPYSSSNAYRQLRAPAPPVEIRVPSMSKRTAWGSLMRARLPGGTACGAVRVALGPVAGGPAVALGGDQLRPRGGVRLDRFGDLLALGLGLRIEQPLRVA